MKNLKNKKFRLNIVVKILISNLLALIFIIVVGTMTYHLIKSKIKKLELKNYSYEIQSELFNSMDDLQKIYLLHSSQTQNQDQISTLMNRIDSNLIILNEQYTQLDKTVSEMDDELLFNEVKSLDPQPLRKNFDMLNSFTFLNQNESYIRALNMFGENVYNYLDKYSIFAFSQYNIEMSHLIPITGFIPELYSTKYLIFQLYANMKNQQNFQKILNQLKINHQILNSVLETYFEEGNKGKEFRKKFKMYLTILNGMITKFDGKTLENENRLKKLIFSLTKDSTELAHLVYGDVINQVQNRISSEKYIGLIISLFFIAILSVFIFFSGSIAFTIKFSLKVFIETFKKYFEGDLSARVPIYYKTNEVSRIYRFFNSVVDKQEQMYKKLKNTEGHINHVLIEIHKIIESQKNICNDQQSTIHQLSKSGLQVSESAEEVNLKISEVINIAKNSSLIAYESMDAMDELKSFVDEIGGSTLNIESKITLVGEKTALIANILSYMSEIAEHANLLSLNGSIQAERSGGQKKYIYGVIAEHLSRLAHESGIATGRIKGSIEEFTQAITRSVMRMEKFSEDITLGIEQIRNVHGSLVQIIEQAFTLIRNFERAHNDIVYQSQGMLELGEELLQLRDSVNKSMETILDFQGATEILGDAMKNVEVSLDHAVKKEGNEGFIKLPWVKTPTG